MKNVPANNLSFSIDRSAAVSTKRALQTAYDRIDGVRKTIFGTRADQLDHAQRDVAVAITLLRDCESDGNCGVRKIERTDPSNKSASSARKGARP